jgi:dTDP-4-dehydrorhamnose reductase
MATPLRILVTGVNGQVGGALMRRAADDLLLIPATRDALDLAQPGSIAAALDSAGPDLVVNCAAYTAVDQAEREPDLARTVNADAPQAMAAWCARAGRPLIHLSTDYVFPGTADRPYRENDPIGPSSVYGATKAAGEAALRETGGTAVILRTAWVYAAEGKNFVRTMLRYGAERPELRVVDDQRGCPTRADNIATAVLAIARRLTGDSRLAGTYHYVDAGETTWFGFARAIFAEAEKYWRHRPTVVPIATADFPTPAKRPPYSVLDTRKIIDMFGIEPPTWQSSVAGVVAEILKTD